MAKEEPDDKFQGRDYDVKKPSNGFTVGVGGGYKRREEGEREEAQATRTLKETTMTVLWPWPES